jgi:membrane dipeptidase
MTGRIDRRVMLASCGAAFAVPIKSWAAANTTSAEKLYRDAIVIDGNLVASVFDDNGVVDAATAATIRSSGLTAMKQTLGGSGSDFAATTQEIDEMDGNIAKNPVVFSKVLQVGDIAAAKDSKRVGVIYSFEAASMHEGRIDRIDHFRSRGVRVMGLSYNLRSPFGTGTLVKEDAGLTPLGAEAVHWMNKLGVSVDLSHSDEPTSFQALAASSRPVLITHAGSSAVHPHPRNKSDTLLRAVADKGGVTGVYELSYLGDYPANPTLDTYMRHLTHMLDVCGEEHVGIGSDSTFSAFDTSPASLVDWNKVEAARKASGIMAPEDGPMPFVQGLNGPQRWEVIANELVRRRYSPLVVDRVLGLNFQRVFGDTWYEPSV